MNRNLNRGGAIKFQIQALETLTLNWVVYDEAYEYLRDHDLDFEQTLSESALRFMSFSRSSL